MLTRRALLELATVGAAAAAVPPANPPFTLPKLPYAYDALEPYIDAQTMQIHHDKHHQAYVDNLNKVVAAEPALAGMTVGAAAAAVPPANPPFTLPKLPYAYGS